MTQNNPVGWIVRVRSNELVAGESAVILYGSGHPDPTDAVDAVMRQRTMMEGESYTAIDPLNAEQAGNLGVAALQTKRLSRV